MDAKWTEILSAWGTESADIRLRKPGVWEIDQRFMLKAYEDEKSLERNLPYSPGKDKNLRGNFFKPCKIRYKIFPQGSRNGCW